MKKIITLIMVISMTLVSFSCSAEDEDMFKGSIHAEFMFMNYETNTSATMMMAYIWEGSDWTSALAAGSVDNMMVPIAFAGGDALAGMKEVEFKLEKEGNYYIGIFQTNGMMHSDAVATSGYYNTGESTYNNMMMPTKISVMESMDYHLETMMIMNMTSGS